MRNTQRFDLSDWLIHFFRTLDIETANIPAIPDHWGFANEVEDTKLSPFFLLRNAVRRNKLWATWSMRGNKRTIYGSSPAVCFTEMPLAAFIESGNSRANRGEAMSAYGLMFRKEALFEEGARPVIYGLSVNAVMPNGENRGVRIIPHGTLPALEQYRYVAYNPNFKKYPIDWTHEREWRFPYRGELPDYEEMWLPTDQDSIPSLEFSKPNLSGMGAVVKTQVQAEKLIYDILTKIDCGELGQAHYAHVLCLENLPDTQKLRDPIEVNEAINANLLKLNPYFSMSKEESQLLDTQFARMVEAIENEAPEPELGEFGGCWLWLLENTHPLVRALVRAGRVLVSSDGRYLAQLQEFSDSRSLRQREDMTRKLADRLLAEFGIESGYFSVLGHDNLDGVPFYCDVGNDNRFFYNYAHDRFDH